MLFLRSVLLSAIIVLSSCRPASHYPDPLSPEEALAAFSLRDGFKIETFASEPYIADPVEMVFDEKGKIYVVEMPDYPYKPAPEDAGSRIRVIEDTDGDGQIDASTIFAEGLMEATSVFPWKGGVFVCAAPDIFYLKDTDGDNVADVKEVWFTGFFDQNSEIQITNLRYGLDNWIYAANFGRSGTITSPKFPDHPPVEVQGADFRFRPEPFEFEATAGPTQFGHDQDDWGHRIVTQNSAHARHLVIPRKYMVQSPLLKKKFAVHPTYEDGTRMYQETPPPYWRAVRTQRRQEQYDKQGNGRKEYDSQHFTGCTGTTFYLADGFPEEYYGTVFTGEVAGNLVHRDLFIPSETSPTFRTLRPEGEKDREFLASRDPWFRPANFYVAPDGYLYVIDMYRQHIETPLSIPEDLKEEMDFYNGTDKGRIYRILPVDSASVRKTQIGKLGGDHQALLELLTHPNRWYRLQAQRMIIDQKAIDLTDNLTAMARSHASPQARIHALYCLEGLEVLREEEVVAAMNDPHPDIREHGIRLGENFPATRVFFPQMIADPSPHVALQAILSTGFTLSPGKKTSLLADAAVNHSGDEWFRMAVLCGIHEVSHGRDFLEALTSTTFFDDTISDKGDLITSLGNLFTYGESPDLVYLLDQLGKPSDAGFWTTAVLEGILKGFEGKEDGYKADPVIAEALVQAFERLGDQTLQEKFEKWLPNS